MKKIVLTVMLGLLASSVGFSQKGKWVELFDGKTLDGWKASERPESFRVEDGNLVVEGQRAHLYYDGPFNNHNFKDFEVQARIMTFPGANSGLYVHTDFLPSDWPKQGYEIQVNNSHTDWRRSASLYNVVDCAEVYVKDNEWYDMVVTVKGNRIVTKLNGITVVDYTQPASPLRNKGQELRLIKNGTIAIQAHDPKSKVMYKSIKVRLL
ncbi:3-keto-disaccharide hydrolase [Aquirufa sp. Wall-65K1]